MIKIPDKIRILDKDYTVSFDKSLSMEKDIGAEIRYRTQEIRLMPDVEGDPRHHQTTEYSFFHELTHGILYAIAHPKENDDEDFVCRFSRVLYQALRDSGMLREVE